MILLTFALGFQLSFQNFFFNWWEGHFKCDDSSGMSLQLFGFLVNKPVGGFVAQIIWVFPILFS